MTECETPNYEKGVCIDIKRCPKLLTLLENQRQVPSVLVFLKKSFCGFEGRSTKVCCALENNAEPVAPVETTVPKVPAVPVEPSGPIVPAAPVPKPNIMNNVGTTNNGEAKLPLQSRCGITNVTRSRIVGGTPAELGKNLKIIIN